MLDILKESITYSRSKINYVLVYDKNKKHRSRHYKPSHENESQKYIQDQVSRKGNTELIRFDLEKYKKLYFKNVHTYTFEEFEDKFVSRFDV